MKNKEIERVYERGRIFGLKEAADLLRPWVYGGAHQSILDHAAKLENQLDQEESEDEG